MNEMIISITLNIPFTDEDTEEWIKINSLKTNAILMKKKSNSQYLYMP